MEPLLIVGHTTCDSTTVWLGGGSLHRSARVALRRAGIECGSRTVALDPSHDYTATTHFDGLIPDRTYELSVHFRRTPAALDRWRHPKAGATRTGTLRTFPARDCDDPFHFLLGSCNLSIVSLSHLAGLVAAALGTLAARESLRRPPAVRLPGPMGALWLPIRGTLAWLLQRGFGLLYWATRFEQPEPLLLSPYEPLSRAAEKPAFAIHAGDQIYFDFPLPRREPSEREYRRAYRQAWTEDASLRTFLGQCPHYMILDDHEIVDDFAADFIPDVVREGSDVGNGALPEIRTPEDYLKPAEKVYREYVAVRHPSPEGHLFYDFEYGVTRFFVLDTRTRRFRHRGEMIDQLQMAELKRWLARDRERLKFVVSSVPFVAELDPSAERVKSTPYEPDKWCDGPYRRQRDEIIEFLFANQITRVVFLVGDMHCTYHATMRVGAPGRRITIHELASGPIHQLQFARVFDFYPHFRGTTSLRQSLPFHSSMRRIHASAGQVLQVHVRPRSNEVAWIVIPTRDREDADAEAAHEPRPVRNSIRL